MDDNLPIPLLIAIILAIGAVAVWLAVTTRVGIALAKAKRSRAARDRAMTRAAKLVRENQVLRRDVAKLLSEIEQLSSRTPSQQGSLDPEWGDAQRPQTRSMPSMSNPQGADIKLTFRKAPGDGADTSESPIGEHLDTSV
jgi:cell division protein FtsB